MTEAPAAEPAVPQDAGRQTVPEPDGDELGEAGHAATHGEAASESAVTAPVTDEAAGEATQEVTQAASPREAVGEAPVVVQPEPAATAVEPVAPVPAPAEEAQPPLDLELLEKRLKETPAIGVFTKLALKNQVDDLLDNFRAFYQGRSRTSLKQLRQPYEMLIMKVLALLQDSDPQLARDILDSREAIWNILADPDKFASI
ncbi:MAG TPA: hypothetical protein VIQ22_04525 [Gammaproteobacteria bacterium]